MMLEKEIRDKKIHEKISKTMKTMSRPQIKQKKAAHSFTQKPKNEHSK